MTEHRPAPPAGDLHGIGAWMIDSGTVYHLGKQAARAATGAGWVALVAQMGRQHRWAPCNVLLSRSAAPADQPLISYGATEARYAQTPDLMWGPVPFVHIPQVQRRIAAGSGAWPGDLEAAMFPRGGRPVLTWSARRLDPRQVEVQIAPAPPPDDELSPVETALSDLRGSGLADREQAASAVAAAWPTFDPPAASRLLGRVGSWPPPGIDELVLDAAECWLLTALGRAFREVDEASC